jgi:predicted RNase H-like HicB family nuclease
MAIRGRLEREIPAMWMPVMALAVCGGAARTASPRQTETTEPRPMELTAVLSPAEEGGYVAFNPETGTTTQGESIEEALANLREATTLYLGEFPAVFKGHPLVTMFSVPAHA